MKRLKINDDIPESFRKNIINFLNRYGDKRITKQAINWLRKVPFASIDKYHGHLIHVLLNEKKNIIAVLAISHFGLEQAIIAVHPKLRKNKLANKLLTDALAELDRLYVKIATDNIPSLKLAFGVGMQAFIIIKGPTGKPTLVLGFGNWDKNEWENYQK